MQLLVSKEESSETLSSNVRYIGCLLFILGDSNSVAGLEFIILAFPCK